MSLNLRRGFFRLWIAVSVLWVIAVATIEGIKRLDSSESIRKYSYSLALDELAESDSPRARDFPEALVVEWSSPNGNVVLLLPMPEPKGQYTITPPDGKATANMFEDLIPKVDYEALAKQYGGRVAGPWDIYRSLVPNEALPALVERAQRMHRASLYREIGVAAMTALAPPVVLLLLGLGVGWIMRGFVSSRSGPSHR